MAERSTAELNTPHDWVELTPDEAISFIQKLTQPQILSTIQCEVIKQCWEGATYQSIAEETAYDTTYIRTIGAQIWNKLSDELSRKITKANFKAVIQQQCLVSPTGTIPDEWMPPRGQVPLGSLMYIKRPPAEEVGYKNIGQPGALIRIKAPKQMGKTSLMARIVEASKQLGYATVTLNLALASTFVLSDSDRFFQWFCAFVSQSLKLTPQLSDYWEPVFGSRYNCTVYFEKYLLPALESPVVLALDNVDIVFNYPDIAADFFGMLRAWYENARYGSEGSDTWRALRIIVVYSTEVYIPLSIHQSPFNVGLPIELDEFSLNQVSHLVEMYRLSWNTTQIEALMALVGGHPYLVRLALYHATQNSGDVETVLQSAIAPSGIYSDYLKIRFWTLQPYPELLDTLKRIMVGVPRAELSPVDLFKLEGMGFIRLGEDCVRPACNLYQQYFQRLFSKPKSTSQQL